MKPLTQPPPGFDGGVSSNKSIAFLRAFRIKYEDWKDERPTVIGRVKRMERLPVICNFQDKVYGCVYYTRSGVASNARMAPTPPVVTDFDLKT
jgi:hypothetical protein